jgi:NAD(P) transhydrogenase
MNYELLVIGNRRESINEALAAARRGELVALVAFHRASNAPDIERHGTLISPSARGALATRISEGISIEVLRRAASGLGGMGQVRMRELRDEAIRIAGEQWLADRSEFESLGVEVFSGDVRFVGERAVEVSGLPGAVDQIDSTSVPVVITARRIVLACGTRSIRPSHVRFDSHRILDVESLLMLDELPRSMIVVGAGETGLDYAMLLGSLGVDVTVVDEQANVFDVYGGLMNDSRLCEMQSLDIAFRLGDEMIGVETRGDDLVAVRLASGKVFVAQAALVCVGRVGETESLNLESAGVGLDERGRVWCDANGGTWASHIQAVGDIVGFRAATALAG